MFERNNFVDVVGYVN